MATFLANLTAGADSILGTSGDDIIQVPSSSSNLSGADTIAGGAGFDTMLFLRDTSLAVGNTLLTNVSGIDEFNVSLAPTVHIFLNDASILQSDSDRLRITFDADPMTLDLRAVSASLLNGIELNGSGTVTLYDVARQSLRIADGVNGSVIGGIGRDALTGGTGADALTGALGDDVLRGNGGADTLLGGDEQDGLYGGIGDDSLVGGTGFDLLEGGTGTNTATGGTEADTFVISAGETLTITDFDITNSYERIDLRAFAGLGFAGLTIAANGGNARITLPSGSSVTLTGVAAAALRAEMFIFAGDAVVTPAAALGVVPYFELSANVDNSTGTSGDDVFEVKGIFSKLAATDIFNGQGGTDTLRVWGEDRILSQANLAGMQSIEVIDLTGATGSHAVTLTQALVTQSGTDSVMIKHGAASLILDTETAGGVGAVRVEGTGVVTLRNADGQSVGVSDLIAGRIQGGSRADEIQGGARNDSLNGNDGNDGVGGGAGNDSLNGGAGDDSLTGGSGTNTVTGGTGTDRYIVSAGETLIITDFDTTNYFERIDLSAFTGLRYSDLVMTDTAGGVEITLPGSTIVRVQGVSRSVMDAGKFFFEGTLPSLAFQLTAGADSFVGGAGDDLFDVIGSIASLDATLDHLEGGAGIDTLRILGVDRVLSAQLLNVMSSVEVIDLSAATGNHAVTLNNSHTTGTENNAITVRFGAGNMILDSGLVSNPNGVVIDGTGVVTLRNTVGQHVNVSDGSNGRVVGGSLDDLITGGAGSDQLNGMAGDDTITGGGGNDSLTGGEGDDRLVSSGGDDQMTGGEGDDIYVVLRDAGVTTLTDYPAANLLERIDLTDFSALTQFSNLTLTNEGADVRITATNLNIVIKAAQASDLDAGDFLFQGQDPLVFNVTPQTPLAELQHLLDEAPAGAIINLAAGVYSITDTLRIMRSDITLVGAGEGQTILRTDMSDDNAGETILVQPRTLFNRLGAIAQDAAEGTTTVTLQNGHGLAVGDLLYLSQANDAAWLAATGNTDWVDPATLSPDADPELSYLRETHSKIVAINGNVITLAEPLPYTFQSGIAQAAQDTFLSNVHLSNFSIQGSWGTANPFLFEDTMPEWASIAALEFDGVRDSSMSNITITDPAAHAFKMQRNYEVTGQDLTAEGAHNKGPSSGYHFYFQESFANDFSGLVAFDGRHAVLFSSFSAEHYNVIEVLETNRDINFHGSPDSDNTIFVDWMQQNYPEGSLPQWKAVSPGSYPEHPFSTIDANDVTFRFAVTGEDHDTVIAGNMASFISTNAGRDTLVGGAGDDTLDGGIGPDTMTGGGGRDRFIRQYEDQDDTILDFQTGAGGDIFVIKGTGYVNFADLVLRQDGANAVLDFGLGGKTTFANTQVAALQAANFIFQTDVEPGQTLTPRADQLFILGTDKADTIVATRSHLTSPDYLVRAGTGYDKIVVNTTSLNGSLASMGSFYKVDAFDVSSVATVAISITNPMAARSDKDKFYLHVGNTGTSVKLDIGALNTGHSVWVDGSRTVELVGSGVQKLRATDSAAVHIIGSAQTDKIFGGARNDLLYGGAGNDQLSGGGGDDTMYGGAGADTMIGGQGSDIFYVDHASDKIIEKTTGTGTDQVIASVSYKLGTAAVETLTLVGDAISGTGDGRKNLIVGNDRNNILDGGGKEDTLVGGLGNDTFVFKAALEAANVDHITDFNAAEDQLELSAAVFGLVRGALAADAFVLGSVAQDANDRILYNQATGQLSLDRDGNGAQAAVLFAILDNKAIISAADFLIV